MTGGLLFTFLATANAAGYRYGASDQAFYVPAIIHAANPASFPRDVTFIDAESRLMVIDDVLGGLVRATGASIEALSFIGYLLSLAVIWIGLTLIGGRLFGNAAATIALAAAFTLRHEIPRTSVNTFEAYFHPRMLAFGIGMLAIASLLQRGPAHVRLKATNVRLKADTTKTGAADATTTGVVPGLSRTNGRSERRALLAIAFVAASALVQVTTGLWFAVLIGVALIVIYPALRKLAMPVIAAASLFGVWALTAGPLRGTLAIMDEQWLQAVASKDTLFATDWPLWAWLINLATWALLYWAYRVRHSRGQHTPEDDGLLWGAAALVLLFLLTLPAVAGRVALVAQLRISRVFWLVDFVATVYVLAALVETPSRRGRLATVLAGVLIAISAIRGTYVMLVEYPERPLFAVTLPHSAWQDAMRWLDKQPLGVHVLADPGHAWKYGTSIRVSPGRDVFLEEVKDSAVAIYSRDVAGRVVERTAALGDFATLTVDRARALAARYDLDYLVTESDMSLPEVYRNRQFRIYALH